MALGFEKIRSSLWIVLPLAILMSILIFLPEIAQALLPTIKDEFAKTLIIESKELFGWKYKIEIAILFAALIIVWKIRYSNFVKVVFTSIISLLLINGIVIPTYATLTTTYKRCRSF